MKVRAPQLADVPDLVETERLVLLDGRGQVRGPNELPTEARMFERVSERLARGGMWVVEVGGRAVGEAELHALGPSALRHVSSLSLHVHPAHQGKGLGRALMGALVEHAASIGIRRLELYVRADNDRAIALYRASCFAIECTRRAFVQRPDGSYVDDHVMVRWLSPTWRERTVTLGVNEGRLVVRQDAVTGWQLPDLPELPAAPVLRSLGQWTELAADGSIEHVHGEMRAVDTLPAGCTWVRLEPGLLAAFPPHAHEVLARGVSSG